MVYQPSFPLKQSLDAAIPVPAILAGEMDDGRLQWLFITGYARALSLGRSRLLQQTAHSPFWNMKNRKHMNHTLPAPGRSQKFPLAASCKMSLSRVNSATAFFSLAFSRSSAFSFLA